MAGSDIRVKLTAEGVDEVVRALGRVQRQAKKTGDDSAKGIGGLTSAFGGLQRLLPAIGIAGVTATLSSLAKQAIDTGDEIAKLSKKTGAGAEALSVLVRAGQTADVTTEQLKKGFKELGASVAELEMGSKETTSNFRALGLSLKDLKGLKPEDQFLLVAQRLAKLPAGLDRTTIASKLFGKAGMELLPLMEDLADGGFENLRDQLQKLGLVWTTEGSMKAEAFNDSVTRVKQASEGLVGQFTSKLIPTLTAFNNLTVQGAKETGTLAQKLGDLANYTLLGAIDRWAPGLGGALSTQVFIEDVEIKTKAAEQEAKAKEEAAEAAAALAAEKARQQAKKVNAAVISAEQQRIQAVLQVQKAQNSLLMVGTENLYKEQIIGLEDYWDAREQVTLRGIDQEVAALQAQKANLKRTMLDEEDAGAAIKLRSDIANIDRQINAVLLERKKTQAELEQGRAEARERLADQELRTKQQILEAQGKTFQAQLVAIRAQADELRKAGVNPQLVDELQALMTKQAEFANLQRQADVRMGAVGAAQDSIDVQAMAGQLFPFEAVERYREAVQEMLPELRAYADALRESAVTDDDIRRAEAFRLEVDQLAVSVDKDAQQLRQFKEALESSLESNLTSFFTNGIMEAESFGDAMRGLALSVVDSLRQIAAQMLATYATQQLLKMGTGIATGLGFASGGLVSGPGTGTSDSIPARLSNGEFVVRSSAVRQPGVLEALTALNEGIGRPVLRGAREVPRFATGGLVRAAEGGAQEAGIVVGLEEGVIVRKVLGALKTKEAQRIQIENLGHNQKRARNALGR